MGRSKSKLVPESYGPSRHLRGPWTVALLQVIAFGGRSPIGCARDHALPRNLKKGGRVLAQ
jgi:hypothetical protein